jgi:hypothetical protein
MSTSVFNRRTFSEKHKKALDLFNSLSGVAIDDQNIIMRRNVAHEIVDPTLPEYSGEVDDLDTFVMTTSADPENTISSTSVKNVINLNVQDGGFF